MGHRTSVTRLLTRPTWGMKWGSFGYIVFHKDGCTLIDKRFHTFCVSLKGSQIQSSAAFLIPDVQVHQRLQEDFQGLVVPIVGLQGRNQLLKCLLTLSPTTTHGRGWGSQITHGDHSREHIGKMLGVITETQAKPELGGNNAQTSQLHTHFFMFFLFCQIIYSQGTKCINVFLYLLI